MTVVVVESPAKAKTIEKYLGSEYRVLASYGHVRDLRPKEGSVKPSEDFSMIWEVPPESKAHIKRISEAVKGDQKLILATDPDREGEAISWHIEEILREQKSIDPGTPIHRAAFNAITKSAVTEAIRNPREINRELVDAYLARRALDFLMGFELSPILWRKLPGAKSAGRVQSVCLRMIVEREMEIDAFTPVEYWSVDSTLETPSGERFTATLGSLGGERVGKEGIGSGEEAERAAALIRRGGLSVKSVVSKPERRNPAPPFITSTLQQEASRKLRLDSRATMSLAQALYEAGHITYMRTDGIDIAPEAISNVRGAVAGRFGAPYLPESPRKYKNKAKNAQEAHECIRPTDAGKGPGDLPLHSEPQRALYELIWRRTLACQMSQAVIMRTTALIEGPDGAVQLRASGQVTQFDGFMKVYEEGRDDAQDPESRILPPLEEGMPTALIEVTPEQHFTRPPPRYTEATLIKRMEEIGIGRPSTYASIVSRIQDASYVEKDRGRLAPSESGKMLATFLSEYFNKYVDYGFTARLEEDLDDISGDRKNWKEVLAEFWRGLSGDIEGISDLKIGDVLEKISDIIIPQTIRLEDGGDPRVCQKCAAEGRQGRLSVKTARSGGAFIGCSEYPECRFTHRIGKPEDGAEYSGTVLGNDGDGVPVTILNGPFGWYVQLGEASEEAPKPKRMSITKDLDPQAVDLDFALRLLSLPREVGLHPEDGQKIEVSIGRYGPYIKHGRKYVNIKLDEVFEIGMNRAVEELSKKPSWGSGQAAKPLRELGEHPEHGGPVNVMSGRFGPYVKHGKLNATIPNSVSPDAITIEEAIALLAARAAKGPRKRKPAARKKPAAKRKRK